MLDLCVADALKQSDVLPSLLLQVGDVAVQRAERPTVGPLLLFERRHAIGQIVPRVLSHVGEGIPG